MAAHDLHCMEKVEAVLEAWGIPNSAYKATITLLDGESKECDDESFRVYFSKATPTLPVAPVFVVIHVDVNATTGM